MLSKDKAEKLMKEALSKRYQNRCEEALKEFNALAKELSSSKKNWAKVKFGEVLHQIGVTFQNIGDYKMSLDYLKQAAAYRQNIKDYAGLAYSQFQIAMCRLAKGEQIEDVMPDFTKADEAIDKALYLIGQEEKKSKKKGENDKVVGDMYQNLGFINQISGDCKSAEGYYKIALIFREKAKDQRGKALTYARQAECNLVLNDLSLARTNAEKALKIFKEIGDIKRIAQVEKNLKEIEQKEREKTEQK